MIKRFFASKSNLIALFFFHLVFLIIVISNFPLDKWFVGWDSLHPEFNFLLNLKRSLFAAWQENYGVGVLTGHGFAALLPHTLITFFASFFIPDFALRPFFTLLCFYVGGIGMYLFTRTLFKLLFKHSQTGFWQNNQSLIDGIALIASFYYLFNLATVQIFYVQLEAFIVHFAALPWLFLCTTFLIIDRSKKHILFFAIVNFLATIQGFIPSLFVAYATGLGIFLLVYLVSNGWSKITIKTSVLVILLTFFINAYWFLPVGYFTLAQGDTFLNSYNNLISTPEFIQRSQKFGDLQDVALLKGFFWDSYELGGPILQPWIIHHQNILTSVVGYLVFCIVIIGFLASLFFIRNWIFRGIGLVGLYFFVSIAIVTPPFSWITELLQWISPTYNQAFRATFTKFGLGNGFFYSLLFAVGLFILSSLLYKVFKQKILLYAVIFLFGCGLFWYAKPLFQGNLLYSRLLLDVPSSYFDLMDYLRNKGDGRIADFPQDCPEGWYSYQWGYFGSGFLWYGVSQPILGRSFDVWSPYNESYYWQISQALREQDFVRVDEIFNKYGVQWLIYDQNFIYCRDEKGVFSTTEFINYISSSPYYQLVKEFTTEGALPIRLYQRTTPVSSYIAATRNELANIGPKITFTDNDNIYTQNNIYKTDTKDVFDVYYPFSNLFSKRGSDNMTMSLADENNEILITSKLPKGVEGYKIRFPAYADFEKYVPVSLQLRHLSGITYEVLMTYQLPAFFLDGKLLEQPQRTFSLGNVTIRDINSISVDVNNITAERQRNGLYESIVNISQANFISIVNGTGTVLFAWNDASVDPRRERLLYQERFVTLPDFGEGLLQVRLPKVRNTRSGLGIELVHGLSKYIPASCGEPIPSKNNKHEYGNDDTVEYIRMISQSSRQCLAFYVPELLPSIGYIIEVKTRHKKGGNLEVYIENKDRPTGLDVFLTKEKEFSSQFFILPPTFFGAVGYDIVFRNSSFNNQETINDVAGIAAWHLPFNGLRNIRLERVGFDIEKQDALISQNIFVEHPNEVFYKVTIGSNETKYLLLFQGFDEGWIAFSPGYQVFPKHILVNNWMNGWEIETTNENPGSQIVYIFYLPQFLEYFGFALLPLPFIYALWPRKKKEGN